ncbi:MAG: hypothetical protein K0S16_2351 [Moraxellaceae bacterium]|nr:hypothetical protein [Moraxellaceae bacterium]
MLTTALLASSTSGVKSGSWAAAGRLTRKASTKPKERTAIARTGADCNNDRMTDLLEKADGALALL